MFLKKLLLATAVTTALAGAAVGITACGEKEEGHVHNYSWNETKAPTCTEPGERTGKCSECDSVITTAISPKGHSGLTETAATDATCGTPGHRAYWTCSSCGQKFADSEGKRQTTDEELKVTVEHSLSRISGKAANCTTEGTKSYYSCTICNKLFSDAAATTEISAEEMKIAAGHETTKVEGYAATCANTGLATYYECTKCGVRFEDEACTKELTKLVLDALGHKTTAHEAKAATCTEDGNIAYWSCSVCNKNFEDEACLVVADEVEIKAFGHHATHALRVEASCYRAGTVEHWYCPDCGGRFADENCTEKLETSVIPITHDWGKLDARVEPTCQLVGKKAWTTCKECGLYYVVEAGSGTEEDPYVYTTYASEVRFKKGLKISKVPHELSVVGKMKEGTTDEIDTEWYATNGATCTKWGYAPFWECSSCKTVFADAEATNPVKDFQKTEANKYKEPEQPQTPPAATADPVTTPESTVEVAPKDNHKWKEGVGMVVEALGHLTEMKVSKDEEGNKVETPIYHYDRYGHWLVCRRDCCKDNPFFNAQTIKKGGEEGQVEGQAEDQKIYNGAVTPNGMEAHNFPKGYQDKYAYGVVCEICGYGRGYDNINATTATTVEEEPEQTEAEKEAARRSEIDAKKVREVSKNDFLKYFYIKGEEVEYEELAYWNLQDDECAIGKEMYSTNIFGSERCIDLTVTIRVKDWYKDENSANSTEDAQNDDDNESDTEKKVEYKDFKIVAVRKQAFAQKAGYINVTLLIPWYMRHIGDEAFMGWTSLEHISFEEAPADKASEAGLYIHQGAFRGLYNSDTSEYKLGDVLFPAHLKGIEKGTNGAFADCGGTFFFQSKVDLVKLNEAGTAFEICDEAKDWSNLTRIGYTSEIYILLTREQMQNAVLDAEGNPVLDENGNPTYEDDALKVALDTKVHYFEKFTESEVVWSHKTWTEKHGWVSYNPLASEDED